MDSPGASVSRPTEAQPPAHTNALGAVGLTNVVGTDSSSPDPATIAARDLSARSASIPAALATAIKEMSELSTVASPPTLAYVPVAPVGPSNAVLAAGIAPRFALPGMLATSLPAGNLYLKPMNMHAARLKQLQEAIPHGQVPYIAPQQGLGVLPQALPNGLQQYVGAIHMPYVAPQYHGYPVGHAPSPTPFLYGTVPIMPGAASPSTSGATMGASLEPASSATAIARRMPKGKKGQELDELRSRTVFVRSIPSTVTEEELAAMMGVAGKIEELRICASSHQHLRFGFIQYESANSIPAALRQSNTMLHGAPIMVERSHSVIQPINKTLIAKTPEEEERTLRTVYVGNLHPQLTRDNVHELFSDHCGIITNMRMLPNTHPTRVAFIEFANVEMTAAALAMNRTQVRGLVIRVTESHTPIHMPNVPIHMPNAM